MDRTAGLLTAARPCGIIVKAQEMYTCESFTQVYAFLLLKFGTTTDDLMRLKFVGYDRECDLHPFLSNLSEKGNVGAKTLLDHVKFFGGYLSCDEAQRAVLYASKQSKVLLSSSSGNI